MTTSMTAYRPNVFSARPSMLGRGVFDDVFESFFNNDSFPTLLRQSTRGYPVADIYRNDNGDTVMEFALAGFDRDELSIDIQPDKRAITVRAQVGSGSGEGGDTTQRRIASRGFTKTFVNYDDNLDLKNAVAAFDNGLLTVTVPQHAEVKPLQLEIK